VSTYAVLLYTEAVKKSLKKKIHPIVIVQQKIQSQYQFKFRKKNQSEPELCMKIKQKMTNNSKRKLQNTVYNYHLVWTFIANHEDFHNGMFSDYHKKTTTAGHGTTQANRAL